ncbi:exopolysaccharide biosynthesis protein [Oligoflexus tunisiensis]|uniref:exopolysaccharide biosynthesis protein n=1 Tax=Oligoflexus tunisiensis TaxID=708132 RepID=UPI00114C936B|nr:exopolysaccharide biosynthesis protein [Oligoflexus tunisiensis]
MNGHDAHSLSREFQEIEDLCDHGSITLQRILDHIHGRGEAMLTLLLAGPFLLPIPMPGLSIPFGILIVIFGFSLSTGWKPWLPQKWVHRRIPEDMLRRFCRAARRFLQKIERFIRPRYHWIHKNSVFKAAAGVMITGCGALLALPLPPGTNAPPAAAIVCLSVALLEGDGLLLVLGYLLFAFNAALFALIPFLGYEAILQILRVGF